MASLVKKFQTDLISGEKSIVELLRTAKLISAKLELRDIEEWVAFELSGYPFEESSIPDYRKVASGILIAHNPYRGWTMVTNCNLPAIPLPQSIVEIEEWGKRPSVDFKPPVNIPITDVYGEMGYLLSNMPQKVVFSGTTIRVIVEAVKDKLLEWSLELEKRNIIGEDMSFEPQEKESAHNQTFNIQNFNGVLGDVTHSKVQIYDYSSIHQIIKEAGVPMNERNEIEVIMDALKTAAATEKKSLLQRGKDWVVKNEKFLGSSSAIILKALGIGEHLSDIE